MGNPISGQQTKTDISTTDYLTNRIRKGLYTIVLSFSFSALSEDSEASAHICPGAMESIATHSFYTLILCSYQETLKFPQIWKQ